MPIVRTLIHIDLPEGEDLHLTTLTGPHDLALPWLLWKEATWEQRFWMPLATRVAIMEHGRVIDLSADKLRWWKSIWRTRQDDALQDPNCPLPHMGEVPL